MISCYYPHTFEGITTGLPTFDAGTMNVIELVQGHIAYLALCYGFLIWCLITDCNVGNCKHVCIVICICKVALTQARYELILQQDFNFEVPQTVYLSVFTNLILIVYWLGWFYARHSCRWNSCTEKKLVPVSKLIVDFTVIVSINQRLRCCTRLYYDILVNNLVK